jgi:hypothetical protein
VEMMKKYFTGISFCVFFVFCSILSHAQTTVKKGDKYDTIIRKHIDKPVVKTVKKQDVKTEVKPVEKTEPVIPTP